VRNARNVLIILVLAAAVAFLPGAGVGASFLGWLLGIGFLGALAWFIARLYREYRLTLYSLGDRNRGLLYGAVGVTVLTLTATKLMWQTAIGTLAWFALLAAAIYAAVYVYRASREY
jgi:hypothetical protein